ncbi:MAG: barstar family protein [Nevskia sp.]|jgi:RNAse (barnase) inhibitor barstar|nr:barstar family protein [Nevskia sp.]MCK9383410.1 barstar family protein [Nevskia sp.]
MTAPLVIDVSSASMARELHAILARHLAFPSYYGHNWDAFWDCVTDIEQCSLPDTLQIFGLGALTEKLPREAQLFQQCLAELQRERPEFKVQLAQQGAAPDVGLDPK